MYLDIKIISLDHPSLPVGTIGKMGRASNPYDEEIG
jgi:hypothetical protein